MRFILTILCILFIAPQAIAEWEIVGNLVETEEEIDLEHCNARLNLPLFPNNKYLYLKSHTTTHSGHQELIFSFQAGVETYLFLENYKKQSLHWTLNNWDVVTNTELSVFPGDRDEFGVIRASGLVERESPSSGVGLGSGPSTFVRPAFIEYKVSDEDKAKNIFLEKRCQSLETNSPEPQFNISIFFHRFFRYLF